MELFSHYLTEINSNRGILFDSNYFITYAICDKELFIEDMYVAPSFRGTGLADSILEKVYQIGKSKGCSVVCSTSKKDRVEAISYQLKSGFRVFKIEDDILYFIKEL